MERISGLVFLLFLFVNLLSNVKLVGMSGLTLPLKRYVLFPSFFLFSCPSWILIDFVRFLEDKFLFCFWMDADSGVVFDEC